MYAFQSISVSEVRILATDPGGYGGHVFRAQTKATGDAPAKELTSDIQGIFLMMRMHRMASRASNAGQSHFVCLGCVASDFVVLYTERSKVVIVFELRLKASLFALEDDAPNLESSRCGWNGRCCSNETCFGEGLEIVDLV